LTFKFDAAEVLKRMQSGGRPRSAVGRPIHGHLLISECSDIALPVSLWATAHVIYTLSDVAG